MLGKLYLFFSRANEDAEWEFGQTRKGRISVGSFPMWQTLPMVLSVVLLLGYASLFLKNLWPYLFNASVTTDDALQQTFPLWEVLKPGIFETDLLASTMKGYLAPVHWWLSMICVSWTGDPVLASHWVTAVQVLGALLFLFLLVRHAAATPAAFFAVVWFLHTRPVIQRMTGGLPRGWSPLVITAFLYFLLAKRHRLVLLTILFGCLTAPPATMIVAIAYGFYLGLQLFQQKSRSSIVRPMLEFLAASPVYLIVTLLVIHRPESVGQMVDFQTASMMPEFQRPYGRFPFLPLDSLGWDFRMYGYQPFGHRLFNPGAWWKQMLPWMLLGLTGCLYLVRSRKKGGLVPIEFSCYGAAAIVVYFLSRVLAFKLYVPNRHLQIPMAIFWICFCSVGLWRLGTLWVSEAKPWFRLPLVEIRRGLPVTVLFFLLSWMVWIGTGDGLYGDANFNYSTTKKGEVFNWIRDNTPETALFAGHPSHIDGLPLFAARRAFATTETTHPFYPKYYEEVKRRLVISLKAHYALSLQEIVDLLEPEGIDYFVFSRLRFYPEALMKEEYFEPLQGLVRQLTAHPAVHYAYKKLPTEVNEETKSIVPFRDSQSVVVSIDGLKKYLSEQSSKERNSKLEASVAGGALAGEK